ncbi:uncharacterized protein VICG_01159 [Vittaforma corneae ATCC 50505]|uniref:FACT complex subunit n=1 Tax=Vittaforma corneae (strain ATCC 50505) TaxID=993615 RepID=L2GNB4_VITCO|nr:uncharacterized protein VICG_01159 [Vittaforma corneae ATCC 50505]ELA41807.1 hypothetical protein VICG_01159 [Vittaforma corneae ATCC 50505]
MNEIQLDSGLFNSRCTKISKHIAAPLLLLLGKSSDVQEYNMNSALFHFLLGYEFPETIIIVQENPIIVTSPKKAVILQQIEGLKIVIKNKDDSNIESILDMFSGVYAVIDKDNIKGDLAGKIFSRVRTKDVTSDLLEILSVKEQGEIDYIFKSGIAANYLLQKSIDLIRDDEFSRDALEAYMDDRIRGIDNSLIEFAFDPEFSSNHLRLGIRYRGYCTEIARRFMDDLSEQYEIQKFVLSLVKPGVCSSDVMSQVESFLNSKGYTSYSVRLYTVGLIQSELTFESSFIVKNKMCFCLNIDNSFCNTFVVNDLPIFVTKKDFAEDYSVTKMRFRNKSNDAQLIARIKEHQKELLESLVEEKVNFYKIHGAEQITEKNGVKEISTYQKDSLVPRSDKIHLDWDNFFVLVPILSYSVPFHISTIKNVSIVNPNDEPRLRINFKESKEIKEAFDVNKECDTKIKFITLRCGNVEDMISQINEMRKEFNKPKISLPTQPVLKEKFKKYALPEVYMRTDNKSANKKILGNLELHENGFKYNDVSILFSNIKNIFLQMGDIENRTILHFNLKEPILFVKPTSNVQFFKKFTVACHDTSKREGEDMELMREKEEEEELSRINAEFVAFVERIEQETNLKVQIPERGFLGVHSREAVPFYLTNECIVSIHELPFFILNLDEVEVVSFERITFVTKTFDCVFIFHDRSHPPVMVGSIETTKLGYLKEVLDSHNILFMENKVNINWNNLMHTIMEDPLSFYESGAWAELLRETEESESEESGKSSSSAYTDDDEENDDTTSYDEDEEVPASSVDSTEEEDDSYLASDSEDYDEYSDEETESESSDEKPKKRKSRK